MRQRFLTIKYLTHCLFPIVICEGCATIMGKSSYDVQFDSSEPGTKVEITEHGKFVKSVITPTMVTLESSDEWHWYTGLLGEREPALYAFKFSKDGFEPQIVCRNGTFNSWYYANILNLCFGMCVDRISGALYEIEGLRVYAEMKKLPISQALDSDKNSVNAAPTTQPLQNDDEQSKPRIEGNDQEFVKQTAPTSYRIICCERETGKDFSYRFVLEINGENDDPLRMFRSIQQKFRMAIKEDYAESFPSVKADSLFVEFPEYKQDNDRIEGRAVVLTIAVTSLFYDPNTRKGKLAVKVKANQYEEARKWIRKNIETLARDKNVALTAGEIPPAAKFYLGREELKDGNVLEIEFKTE